MSRAHFLTRAVSGKLSRILSLVFAMGAITVVVALPTPANAASQAFSGDFCWNYFIVPCPKPFDFYWRPETPISLGRPSEWQSWVSVVAPVNTYFFMEPAPQDVHVSHNYFVFGWGYDWNVFPAAFWKYGDDHDGLGQTLWDILASTRHPYPRSSYGQTLTNPHQEPSFEASSTVLWFGEFWWWRLQCSVWPPICWPEYHRYFLVAWQTRHHPIAVRQILPMNIGN